MPSKPLIQLHLPDLYVGGIERWALSLMNGLPEFEWVVTVAESAVAHETALAAFRRFRQADPRDPDLQPDALITTWGVEDRGVRPTIAVAHSAFQKYQELIRTIRYDYAVAVSAEARTCFPATNKVEIIPNGVDLTRLQPREPRAVVRARLGLPEEAVVVGYVGRWGRQKNPLAAARAAAITPGAVALYVGPPPDNVDWTTQAERLAPCRFVSPDEAEHIGDLYRAMDVAVFASLTEGFGLAIAEAWWCEVPVVATRVGVVADHPDLVALAPQERSDEALKAAVDEALSDVGRRRLASARSTVEQTYSAEAMVGRWRDYIVSKLA